MPIEKQILKSDFCVIGAGSGGLSFAAGAAQMGASVILVESGKMGGDCLNYGCVPSKALLAAAKIGHYFQEASDFGWHIDKPKLNFKCLLPTNHCWCMRKSPSNIGSGKAWPQGPEDCNSSAMAKQKSGAANSPSLTISLHSACLLKIV